MRHRFAAVLCALALLAAPLFAAADTAEEKIEPAYPVQEAVTRLLETAGNEIGYEEGEHGWTKYGAWSGDGYAQWCAEFLCWCVDQTDQAYGTGYLNTVWPLYSGSNTGRDWFIRNGRYVSRNGNVDEWGYQWLKGRDHFLKAGEYIPQPGDWVFFTWTADDSTDHVALVEYCTRAADGSVNIHVIEGNSPVRVQRSVYALSYRRILGYGTVNDVMDITMRYNCTGTKVYALQEKLAYLGYLKDRAPSGTYGTYTAAAVRSFQTEHGLKVTGIASLQMQAELNKAWERVIADDPAYWMVTDNEEDE